MRFDNRIKTTEFALVPFGAVISVFTNVAQPLNHLDTQFRH